MTERNRADNNLEQRLRDHYQQRYELPPDPMTVWTRVLPHLDHQEEKSPGLVQRAKRLPGLVGRRLARQRAALKYLHEEHTFMQDEISTAEAARNSHLLTPQKPSPRRRLLHIAEAGIAAVVVASLLIAWLAVTHLHNTQGTMPGSVFSYTGQPGESLYYPQMMPDEQHFTFMACKRDSDNGGCHSMVWNAATGQVKQTATLPAFQSSSGGGLYTSDSSDGHYSLMATYDASSSVGTITLVNILTGQVKQIYQRDHYSDVPAAAFSNGSNAVAFIGGDGSFHIWDIATGKTTLISPPLGGPAQQIGWSLDNKQIVISLYSQNGEFNLQSWSAQTGQRLANVVESSTMSALRLVSPASMGGFSPNGQYILTFNPQTGSLEVRESSTLRVIQTLPPQFNISNNLDVTATWLDGGARILFRKGLQAYLWNTTTGQLLGTFPLASVHSIGLPVASTNDGEGTYVSLLQPGNRLTIKEARTGQTVSTIPLTINPQQLTWLSGRYLAVIDQNGQGRLYNALTGQQVKSFQGTSVSLSADSRYLAVIDQQIDAKTHAVVQSTLQVLDLHG